MVLFVPKLLMREMSWCQSTGTQLEATTICVGTSALPVESSEFDDDLFQARPWTSRETS